MVPVKGVQVVESVQKVALLLDTLAWGLYTIVNAATGRKLVADTQGFYTATTDFIPKTHLWRIIPDENATHLIQNAALEVRSQAQLQRPCIWHHAAFQANDETANSMPPQEWFQIDPPSLKILHQRFRAVFIFGRMNGLVVLQNVEGPDSCMH